MGIQIPDPQLFAGNFLEWWHQTRRQIQKDQRRIFDGGLVYLTWTIWLERNNRIFDNLYDTVLRVVHRAKELFIA